MGKMGLKQKALELNSGIEFMQGRDKGEVSSLLGAVVTIKNYDWLTDTKSKNEYLVFVIDEDDKNFYFGGQVLSEKFSKFDDEDKQELITEGLPTILFERKSKNGREYVDCTFYPSAEEISKILGEGNKNHSSL